MPRFHQPSETCIQKPTRWFSWMGHVPIVPVLAAAVALLSVSGIARAQTAFTLPAGVTDYRLLFVTPDKTPATSADINYYNSFATTEAALNPDLPTTTWTAIITTTTVNAVDNISCGAYCDANVPIYLVDGTTLVATSTDALFASNLANPPDEDVYGNYLGTSPSRVWTGSSASGGILLGVITFLPHDVGDPYVEQGNPAASDSNAIAYMGNLFSLSVGFGNEAPIYAISGEIDVPEPASTAALLTGGLMGTLIIRRRRKNV